MILGIILMSLVPSLRLSGSDYAHRAMYRYNADSGLPDNAVRCVAQDKHGFIWLGTGSGLVRFDGYHYDLYVPPETGAQQKGNNTIYSIYIAPNGIIWLGTRLGVTIYDPALNVFSDFRVKTIYDVVISTQINSISGDDRGRVWFGTGGQGLFVYNTNDRILTQNSGQTSLVNVVTCASNGNLYTGSEMGTISEFTPDGEFIRTIHRCGSAGESREVAVSAILVCRDTVWVALSTGGLKAVSPWDGKVLVDMEDKKSSVALSISKILQYDSHTLMLGTANGLLLYDIPSERLIRVTEQNEYAPRYNPSTNDIFRDSEGGIWVATRYAGVDYLPQQLKAFDHFNYNGSPAGSLAGRVVSCFSEEANGNLWVGTHDAGVMYLEKSGDTGPHRYRMVKTVLPRHNIQCVMQTEKEFWIGTTSSGIFVLEHGSGRIRNYKHDNNSRATINDNNVKSLLRDSRGTIYVGTAWGLSIYQPHSDDFIAVPAMGNQAQVCTIIQDHRGNMWFGTGNMGAFQFDPYRKVWTPHMHNKLFPNSICGNVVHTMFEDRSGRIWAGTDTGLCHYSYNKEGFTTFDANKTVLKGQPVYSIRQDDAGYLWLSSSGGLIRFDPDNDTVAAHFTRTDGLQSNQFSIGASLRCADGTILTGGNNGFNYFQPSQFRDNTFLPCVRITDVVVDGKALKTKDNFYSDHNNHEVKVKGLRSSLGINFAALSYQSPTKNNYRYMLAGWDNGWIEAEGGGSAIYGKLPAGKYTFRLSGSNSDGLWNPAAAVLTITVLPPFYKSAVAVVFYLLLAAAIILAAIRAAGRRQRRRLRQYAHEQERKADRSKIDFFTNIAHEIRTPLSLIKVPLEHLINIGDQSSETKRFLRVIEKNTDSLLVLINQLLDFRKSERHDYHLTFLPADVVDLTSDICDNFSEILHINNIELRRIFPERGKMFNVDGGNYQKIVSNLLSNASKYAVSLIEVTLEVYDDHFCLRVADDGPGISRKEMSRVFETFYQSDRSKGGTGIGLPLVKLLTGKHNGRISVGSSQLGGAEFTLSIPMLEQSVEPHAPGDAMASSPSPAEAPVRQPGSSSSEVLIVEDDRQLRQLMAEILAQHYKVRTADNGIEALKILDEYGADLVVSDVVMPEMDGYELCRRIKSDLRYCHIPVIQLTARTSSDDHRRGLETGADSYMEKPFSIDLLRAQIDNLLENRRLLRQAYSNSWFSEQAETRTTGRKDEEFIAKLNKKIAERIDDEKFYVEDLAESMLMSRSNFYRKIKALFGVSPNDYLKKSRMRYAITLMKGGEKRVNDLCFQVGFNSPSYFSKCFREEFGCTPSEYIERFIS